MGGARGPHLEGIFKTNGGSYDVCVLFSQGQSQRLATIVASTVSVRLLICWEPWAENVLCIRITRRSEQPVVHSWAAGKRLLPPGLR